MLLIEVNPRATQPEFEFTFHPPEYVANRNRTSIANGKETAWVVVGTAEDIQGAKQFIEEYRAARGGSAQGLSNV